MKKIPFLNLAPQHSIIRNEMAQAFETVYDSNWFVMGQKVTAFKHD